MTQISSNIPTTKLWNPKSFIIFSVIFSFLPAGIICSLNYGRLGDHKKKWITLIATILGFIVFITLASLFSVKNSSFLLPVNIGIGIFLRNIQKELYNVHIQNGGKRASYFLPIFIGVLYYVLVIGALIYTADTPRNSIAYGQNNVYYTNTITELEAKKLGDYFKSGDVFTDNTNINVKLNKEKDIYVFSLMVKADAVNDQELINSMKEFSKNLSKDVFNNNNVRVDLCDNTFKVLKSLN